MSVRKQVVKYKKGKFYDCTEVDLPKEWFCDYFSPEASEDPKYESWNVFECIHSFQLTITVKQ